MALKEELTERRDSLRQAVQDIDALRVKINEERYDIEALINSDEWPTSFTGVADKYRYRPGKGGTDGTHQFQLTVKPGVILMCKVPEANWRLFIRNMEGKNVKSMGKLINGKALRCQRSGNFVVPISVDNEPRKFYSNTDRNGNQLYKGARVTQDGGNEEGTITGRANGVVEVVFDNGSSDTFNGDGLRLVA